MRCRILALVGLLCRPDIGTNQNYFTPITITASHGVFTILVLLLLFVGLSRMSRPILDHIGTEHLNKVYQFEWLMVVVQSAVFVVVVVHQRNQWWMRAPAEMKCSNPPPPLLVCIGFSSAFQTGEMNFPLWVRQWGRQGKSRLTLPRIACSEERSIKSAIIELTVSYAL